jgi:hypothetical protein
MGIPDAFSSQTNPYRRDAWVGYLRFQVHVPPAWNKWCPTDLPAHDTEVDEAMLFVPLTTPSG